jgi:hypothetical protein
VSSTGTAFGTFRPYRGRIVATVVAVVAPVVFGVLAIALPGTGLAGWGLPDSLLLFGFGLLITALMWRFMTVRAVPTRTGLTVRNLLLTRSVTWDEIEGLRFTSGDAWAWLDLTNGEDVAVMAIQRADGDRGRAEAGRLAALLQTRGGSLRPSS